MVSVVVAVVLTVPSVPDGTIRRGLGALRRELPAFLLATVTTAILCFTRVLSHPPGVAGVGDTLGAWWRLLTESSGQPAAFFLMALLVYEPIAVVFAVASVVRNRSDHGDAIPFFAVWSMVAFGLWSFAAGSGPAYAIHVALPLVLLAGIALGRVLHAIDWRDGWHGSGGLLALLMLGIVVGLAAVGVLLTRVDDLGGGPTAALPPVAVLCLVVVPLVYLGWRMRGDERDAGHERQPVVIALFVAALLLGAFGLRSANLLAFSRADLGTELLANGRQRSARCLASQASCTWRVTSGSTKARPATRPVATVSVSRSSRTCNGRMSGTSGSSLTSPSRSRAPPRRPEPKSRSPRARRGWPRPGTRPSHGPG